MKTHDYDILLLSDLRYPGGNSASIVEEIKAQARAGYSTGLVHLRAPHMVRRRSFNRRIMHCLSAGLAELVPAGREVRARALVIRQPRLFTEELSTPLRIRAEATVLVVNHPPVDGLRPAQPYYDPGAVRDRVAGLFGEVAWAPIGPLVRSTLLDSGAALDLRGEDWVNIVDVEEWWTDRTRFRADRPVIGRHSRGHRSKWPSARADVLAAYPPDEGVSVKILGGADPAIQLLGYEPSNWTVYPFGSRAPQRFLGEIDFFVYYHHPGWVESLGRNIIEGMASGCPAILPPHFERVFGPACSYVEPAGVRAEVERLYRDPKEYRARSQASASYAEERFGATRHLQRIRELIGEPSNGPMGPRATPRRPLPRVLLVSCERRGAGSVVRLTRIAGAMSGELDPVVLAPWPAIGLAREAGLLCEVVPDEDLDEDLDEASDERLVQRVLSLAEVHDVEAIVLDVRRSLVAGRLAARVGPLPLVLTGPPSAALTERGLGPAVATVRWDDALLEDTGGRSVPIAGGQPLSMDAARIELGLAGGPLALLCPGADGRSVAVARLWPTAQTLLAAGWGVVFAEPLAGGDEIRLPDAVTHVAPRPLWRYLAAFDVAVAAAGHTLTHELLAARRPSLLVPFDEDAGRAARSVAARGRGLALALEDFTEARLADAVARLSDPAVRDRLAEACGALRLDDGTSRVLDAVRGATHTAVSASASPAGEAG